MMQAVNSVIGNRMFEAGELTGNIEFKDGRVSVLGKGNYATRLLIDTDEHGKSVAVCPIWGTTEHTHEQDNLDLSLEGDVADLVGMLSDANIWAWWEEGVKLYTKFAQPRNEDAVTNPAQITGAIMWHSNVDSRSSVLTVITDARSFQVNIKP